MAGFIGRKKIAVNLLTAAGLGNLDVVEPLLADDFVLEQMVRDADSATAPAGTRYGRETYLSLLNAVSAMTQSGMNLSIDLLVEEGNHIAAFGTSNALSQSGWCYRNAYCWHLVFTDQNQVSLMRGFYDTALGNQLLAR